MPWEERVRVARRTESSDDERQRNAAREALRLISGRPLAPGREDPYLDWNQGSMCPVPLGTDLSDTVQKGAFTFKWVGQIRYGARSSETRDTWLASRRLKGTELPAVTPPALSVDLAPTTRIDLQGRVWDRVRTDVEAFETDRAARRSRAEADGERLAHPLVKRALRPWREPEPPDEPSTRRQGWTSELCGDDGPNSNPGLSTWFGDDNRTQSQNLTNRQSGALKVNESDGSASLVDPGWALTAAHVVTTTTWQLSPLPPWGAFSPIEFVDVPVNPATVDVHAGAPVYGNIEAHYIVAIYLASADSLIDTATDAAMLELGEDFGSEWQPMLLSEAGDDTLEGKTMHLLGWAPFGPQCDSNQSRVLHGTGGIKSMSSKVVRTFNSSSEGQSGGPGYYCPLGEHDVCEPLDPARVVYVHANVSFTAFFIEALNTKAPKVPGHLGPMISGLMVASDGGFV